MQPVARSAVARALRWAGCLAVIMTPQPGRPDAPAIVDLPAGVRAVWDAAKAFRESTTTRERICLNGLWRWRPGDTAMDAVPAGGWGFFKVPGSWPGTTDYMQKDCQTVFTHPDWKDVRIRNIASAWYQREIDVPAGWTGRRIALRLEYLNSYAVVYLDGARAGELRFPGGALDLTTLAKPGAKHVLTLAVTAMPAKAVMMSYADSARAKEVKGEVQRRGLCGDAWLVGEPAGPSITGVQVATSVRRGEVTVTASLNGLTAGESYLLRGRITEGGKTVKKLASAPFTVAECVNDRFSFTAPWKAEHLWDLNTPGAMEELDLALESHGRVLDAALPERFGFRELWIEGRDILLNGTRIFISSVPVDNAAIGAGAASEAGARETFRRLKAIGINAVYSHNYGTEPGSHLDMSGVLRAADAEGMLVFFAQPHFGEYEWKGADADATNGYARDAAYFTRIAGNHPSVVLYAMSHNGCGYGEDMNPDMLGTGTVERDGWSLNNSRKALRAEAIVRALDPSRIVYHHAGGDLGSMHTVNDYQNFSPAQEQADWLASWAAKGVKPLFLCEWGVPLSWDWTMYRGWYKGAREFGSGEVPWEFCHAEWNAQFDGDRAFAIGEPEKRNLRWEAGQFRDGRLWHRWDYPVPVGSNRIEGWDGVVAATLATTLRADRGWGLSAYCIWDHGAYWTARDGVSTGRRELPVDWDHLQQPGFSADYVDEVFDRFDVAYDRADWTPTAAGRAIIRNNGPRLGFIAGPARAFTEQDHAYRPGETVEKLLVAVNNSRADETCAWSWTLEGAAGLFGSGTIALHTGEITRVPVAIPLPILLPAGRYTLAASFRFGNGEVQDDTLALEVVAPDPKPTPTGRIAIFDPEGDTTRLLAGLGITGAPVGADADLAAVDLLIIGRRALTVDQPAPDLARVRAGLKVIVFEQSAQALEQRLGFRATEYGLRNVFRRVPGSPLLTGLDESLLHDWRGEATLVPPRRAYTMEPMHGPMIAWCGIPVSRAWRCGTRGCVASVLIEKPARGDFLPVLDGGFSLQYSPLLVHREGRGLVVFCQMDVSGRTTGDPAADRLVTNLMNTVMEWTPAPGRHVVYAGDPGGAAWLGAAGLHPARFDGTTLPPDAVLVVAPGGGMALSPHRASLEAWIRAGGPVLALGLDGAELNRFLPVHMATTGQEHLAAVFDPEAPGSPLAGVGPADIHDRAARTLPLVTGGAAHIVGDGVLAVAPLARLTAFQEVPWSFDYARNYGLKRTFRRASYAANRLLANLGAAGTTPLLERFHNPAQPTDKRYLDGLYLDQPEEWDDPYRFFRW